MTDNYLSVDEIVSLADRLKASPERSYTGIGVRLGGDIVEIFTPENYSNLLGYLLNSPELNVNSQDVIKLKTTISETFKKLENESPDHKIGKLASAFVLVKRKNLAPNWFFYNVPVRYQHDGILRYSLATPQPSPRSVVASPPPIFVQQTVGTRNTNRNTPFENKNTPVGNRNTSFENRNNQGMNKNTPVGNRNNQGMNKNTPVGNRNNEQPVPVLKPLFGQIASSINTYDANKASLIASPTPRQSNISVFAEEKNKIVDLISKSFESIPHTKILCDRKSGKLSLVKIDEDEDFETSGYQYCTFHSGGNFDGMAHISESLRRKITGPYGYLTKNSECYDCCYRSITSKIDSNETAEIEDQRKKINGILVKVESEINEFNDQVTKYENLSKDEFIARQTLHVATAEFTNDLGENADHNVQQLQLIANDPLLKTKEVVSRVGRVTNVEYILPNLQIMNHTMFSSFFGMKDSLLNELDQINITASIDDYNIKIALSQNVSNQIMKAFPDLKNNIEKLTAEIYKNGDLLYIKFATIPIVFSLSSSEAQTYISASGSTFDQSDESDEVTVKISPVYIPGSYRSAIYSLGISFAKHMGIYQFIEDKYNILLNLGACYISKYGNILSSFVNHDVDPVISNKYNVVKSLANTFELKINEIETTISSIEELIDNEMVLFNLGNLYKLELKKEDAKSLLRQLKSFPEVNEESMKFSTNHEEFEIPTKEVSNFFRDISSALNDLSNKAKNEDLDVTKFEIKMTAFQKSNYLGEVNLGGNTKQSEGVIDLFDAIKVKEKQVKEKHVKKPKNNITGSSFIDDSTKVTDYVEIKTDNYNTRYFDTRITVAGVTLTCWECMNLLEKYFNITNIDFANGTIKVLLDRIPLTTNNMDYLFSILFAENEEMIQSMFEDGVVVDRKYALSALLFGSSIKYFDVPNHGLIKLRSELKFLNPFTSRNELGFAIPAPEAKQSRLLSKYIDYSERIDKVALLARRATIEKFGEDLSKSIFTGFQPRVNGVSTSVNFLNREAVIPAAGEIMRTRQKLRSFYIDRIKPFLDKIHSQDGISNDIVSFYNTASDYIVYATSGTYKNEPQLVVPTNPFYILNDVEMENEETFPTEFSEYVEESQQTIPLESQNPSAHLTMVMKLMFPDANAVTLFSVNPRIYEILLKPNYALEMSKLGLLIKFKDVIQSFGQKLKDKNVSVTEIQIDDTEKVFQRTAFEVFNDKIKLAVELADAITLETIGKNKTKGGLPDSKGLEKFVNDLVNYIRDLLKVGEIEYRGMRFRPDEIFETFMRSFVDIPIIFNERRMRMRLYVKELITKLYNVKFTDLGVYQKFTKFDDFKNVDKTVLKNNQTVDTKPDKVDVIEKALEKVLTMIDYFSNDKVDATLRVSDSLPSLDLDERLKIYDKFADMLIEVENISSFNTMMKGISYYMISNLDRKYYENYLMSNYDNVMKSISDNTISMFKQDQERFKTDLELMISSREKKITSTSKLITIGADIKKIENVIDSKKNDLMINFISYIALIDIIVKSYEIKKSSYGSDDSVFKEIIDNMKNQRDNILKSYEKVNNLNMKITLAIYNDNFDIYNIRKGIYKDFNVALGEIDQFNSVIEGAVKYIKTYQKLSRADQIEVLNNKINKYDKKLSVKSTISELSNSIRLFASEIQDEIRKEFVRIKFADQIFDLMRVESENIKHRLFTFTPTQINIQKRENQPKFENYGAELNLGLNNYKIDQFTYQETTILGKNIVQFLDMFQTGLRVIDSGPGLHLLSDAVEAFQWFIGLQFREDVEPVEVTKSFSKFLTAMQKFTSFNTAIGKSMVDIIQSSEFKMFVSIINGKMDEFESITSAINYYNETGTPFAVYNSLSPNFVRGLLLTMNEVFLEANVISVDTILERFSTNCDQKFDYDSIDTLMDTITDFNLAIIPFIDEYVDDDGNILNDVQVAELKVNYNIKTRGTFMTGMFKKLNRCMKLYIKKQNEEFDKKVIDVFVVYVELFNTKFKTLENLEKFMIKR